MVSKRKRKNEPKGGRRRSTKEHDRDIRLARTETSAVSEHAHNTGHKPLWSEAKFIDRDPCYYTRMVRKAIHIRLHPNNINRDSGIEIPEAWILTIKNHNNRRAVRQRTADGANHWVNSKDRNAPIRAVEKTTNHSRASYFMRSRMTSRTHRLKKTSSMQSKRRDIRHTWLHRETNEKLSFYCYSPRWITSTFSTKRAQSTPNIIVNTGSKKSVSSVLVKRDNLKQMYPTWEAMTHQMHHHKLRTKNPKGMTEVMQQKKEGGRWEMEEEEREKERANKQQILVRAAITVICT